MIMERNLTCSVTQLNGCSTSLDTPATINQGLIDEHIDDKHNHTKITMQFSENDCVRSALSNVGTNENKPEKRLSQQNEPLKQLSTNSSKSTPASMKPTYEFATGEIITVTLTKNHAGLGLSLAGNRDRMKTSVFICGINPEGPAAIDGQIKIGDEILEVNDVPIYGRCHLNASAIMKSLTEPTYTLVLLRRDRAIDDMAVKHVSTFPTQIRPDLDHDDLRTMNTLGITEYARGNRSSFSSINEESLRSDEDAKTRKITTSTITTIELQREKVGLGISIIGGVDTPLSGVFVHEILPGGAAHLDGRLRSGDRILFINGQDLTNCTHEQATALLQETPAVIGLTVFRDCDTPVYSELELELDIKPGKPLGLKLSSFVVATTPGVFVDEIIKYNHGCDLLTHGDKILKINEHNLSNATLEEVASVFRLACGRTKLLIGRLRVTSNPVS